MCLTCGCGADDVLIRGRRPSGKSKAPVRFRPHSGAVAVSEEPSRIVSLEQDILHRNDEHARGNRALFAQHGILALNLVSSPGSGKTSLLVRTLQALRDHCPLAVIEGDQQTEQDAERIRATGVPAVQINTGKGCHLDAQMVERALPEMGLVRFHDMASGQRVWLDTGETAVRGAVRSAFADHLTAQAVRLARAGVRHQQLDSAADDLAALLIHG